MYISIYTTISIVIKCVFLKSFFFSTFENRYVFFYLNGVFLLLLNEYIFWYCS